MVKHTINEELCKGCGLCVRACPKKIFADLQDQAQRQGLSPGRDDRPRGLHSLRGCARTCPDVAIRIEKE